MSASPRSGPRAGGRTSSGTEQGTIRSLAALRAAEASCRRCPLYRNATQAVPGAGASRARLMLVGEQPGDKEDLMGAPFVGPAGNLLDKALRQAGVDRREVFVTNAVKHFKFEQRGKKRLHKRPNAYEIDRCKWWNDLERAIVRPRLVVALGATAGRSLFGRPVAIGKGRGKFLELQDDGYGCLTIHPSAILRLRDEADRKREFGRFVADLKACAAFVARSEPVAGLSSAQLE